MQCKKFLWRFKFKISSKNSLGNHQVKEQKLSPGINASPPPVGENGDEVEEDGEEESLATVS